MEFPCDCIDMKWAIKNTNIFIKEEDKWILRWIELDKTDKGINIEQLGIRFKYCMFCGKEIKS